MVGGGINISGGNIGGVQLDGGSDLSISGGTIEGIHSISGQTDITGGVFPGSIYNVYAGCASGTNISGGSFSGKFGYSGCVVTGVSTFNFIGYPDLTLSTPTLISDGNFETYEANISGTLRDGSYISQTITCKEQVGATPCGLVAFTNVPAPSILWLVGVGLPFVIGTSKLKKAV